MSFNKEKHVEYWQRCHNSFLPSAYTANDSTRLTLACFTLCAYDLLSIPLSATSRAQIRRWVLSLQHPNGGFCGSSTHSYTTLFNTSDSSSSRRRTKAAAHNEGAGTANIAATFFALVCLALVAEDAEEQARNAFAGVRRRKLLRWLRRLQRPDGSFGQNLWEGETTGGRDMRHSYLASCIRWMVRGDAREGQEGWLEDLDGESMVRHIGSVQTYDGGLSDSPMDESHAGYVYCGIAALWMLDRPVDAKHHHNSEALNKGVPDIQGLLNFLASRQFPYLAAEEEADGDEERENYLEKSLAYLDLSEECQYVGYNGRWNKKADTCYTWWGAASLQILGHPEMVNEGPSRQYLLDITQHRIGGFGKTTGSPPDIYHSYLGLAALAILGFTDDLKEFDIGLCCSRETVEKMKLARQGLLEMEASGEAL